MSDSQKFNRRELVRPATGAGLILMRGRGLSQSPAAPLFARRSAKGLIEMAGAANKQRITSARLFVYDTGRKRPNYWKPDELVPSYGFAFRLTTDSGAEGCWGDEGRIRGLKKGGRNFPIVVYASVRNGIEDEKFELDIDAAQQRLSALLTGRSPAHIEAIWNDLFANRVPVEIISIVDMALWDLCARIEGQPVWRLIGQKRDKVKVYISSAPSLAGPESWAQHAVACKKRGYHAYKIHPYIRYDPVLKKTFEDYRGFPEHDLPVCRAVREAVGPGFPVMLDNAWGYSYEQAVQVGKVLDELKFAWYESPMPESDAYLDRYARLRKAIRTPICAPQAGDDGHLGRLRWIQRGACDVCRVEPYPPGGGITSCIKTAEACAAAGLRLDFHAWGLPVINTHVLGALPEQVAEYQELYDGAPERSLKTAGQKVDRALAAVRYPLYEPDAHGYLALPDTVGLGVRVDWEFVRAHAARP